MKSILLTLLIAFTYGLSGQYSWSTTNGIPYKFFIHETIVKSNDSIFIFGQNRQAQSFAFPGVCFSSDGGDNWSLLQISSFNTWESTIVAAVYVNNKFIIQVYSDLGTYKLYSSTDAKNWSPLNSNLPSKFAIGNFVVDNNQQLVCAGVDAGTTPYETRLYKSTNGGTTWNKIIPQGLSLPSTLYSAISYSNNKWLLCSRDSNLTYQVYSSTDGVNWQTSGIGLPSTVRINGFTQLAPNLVLTIGSQSRPSLYVSKDGGSNWSLITTSGLATHNHYYSCLANNDQSVFLGAIDITSNHMLFSSDYLLSSSKEEKSPGFTLYPNPATDRIEILVDGPKHVEYKLSSVNGTIVIQSSFYGNAHEINTSKLSKGTYFLYLQDASNIAVSKLVVK